MLRVTREGGHSGDLCLVDAVQPLRAGGVAVVGQVGVEPWVRGGHCNQ